MKSNKALHAQPPFYATTTNLPVGCALTLGFQIPKVCASLLFPFIFNKAVLLHATKS